MVALGPRSSSSWATFCGSTSDRYWLGELRKKALLRRMPSTRCSTSEPLRPRTITMPCPGPDCWKNAPGS